MADGLTPNQARFVAEYLIDLNGKQSAIRAGYSEKTAESQASSLLRNPKVRAAVQAGMDKRAKKLEISADRVLQEIAKMAFVDERKFFNDDGSIKNVTELDDDTAAALQGFEVEKLYQHFAKGAAQETGTVSKIKIADKTKSLELLGRHLKLFTDKVEVSGLDGLYERLQEARKAQ